MQRLIIAPFAALRAVSAPSSRFTASTVSRLWLGSRDTTRGMGIMDKVRDTLDKQKEKKVSEKRTELFVAQVNYLANNATYTLAQHLLQLQESAKAAGITSWKAKLRSTEEQQELESQFAEIKIGEAMTPEELEDPKLVDRRAKLRIAAQLGVDVSKVNRFLHNYEEMLNMHHWLRKRVERELPIPKEVDEYRRMMMEDPTGTSRKQMQKNLGRVRSVRAMYR